MKWRYLITSAAAFVLLFLDGGALLAVGTSSTATVAMPIVDPSAGNSIDVLTRAVTMLRLAFEHRSWMLAAGLLLTIVVVVFRMFDFGKRLPDTLVPWATLGVATVTSMALGLQIGKSWTTVLVTGVSVGVVAVGGWESFGKLLKTTIDRFKKKPSAAPATPLPAEMLTPPVIPPEGTADIVPPPKEGGG